MMHFPLLPGDDRLADLFDFRDPIASVFPADRANLVLTIAPVGSVDNDGIAD